jgi:hypothetical protein
VPVLSPAKIQQRLKRLEPLMREILYFLRKSHDRLLSLCKQRKDVRGLRNNRLLLSGRLGVFQLRWCRQRRKRVFAREPTIPRRLICGPPFPVFGDPFEMALATAEQTEALLAFEPDISHGSSGLR